MPVVALGLILGIHVATGMLGLLVFVLMAGVWGLAFTGFPYAIALRTGNPTAVNNAFLLSSRSRSSPLLTCPSRR